MNRFLQEISDTFPPMRVRAGGSMVYAILPVIIAASAWFILHGVSGGPIVWRTLAALLAIVSAVEIARPVWSIRNSQAYIASTHIEHPIDRFRSICVISSLAIVSSIMTLVSFWV